MQKGLIRIVVVLFTFTAAIVVLLLIGLCLLLIGKHSLKKFECEDDPKKILHVNMDTNETSPGFAYLNRCLKRDEYISYQVGDGKLSVISSFGVGEYICKGSCYCENLERRSGAVLGRSIFHLFAVVTSVLAYQEAKQFFNNDCVHRLSGQCSPSSVQAEVEDCQKVETAPQEQKESTSDSENENKLDIRTYTCKGGCLPKAFKRDESIQLAEEFDCSKLKLEMEIDVDCTKLVSGNSIALWQFRERLTKFCHENSASKTFFNYSKGNGQWKDIFLCVGVKKGNINHTTHCRQLTTYRDKRGGNALKHWRR